jgi:hypothetical protein
LVRLWNITLRFTGVDGPATRISSIRSSTFICMHAYNYLVREGDIA